MKHQILHPAYFDTAHEAKWNCWLSESNLWNTFIFKTQNSLLISLSERTEHSSMARLVMPFQQQKKKSSKSLGAENLSALNQGFNDFFLLRIVSRRFSSRMLATCINESKRLAGQFANSFLRQIGFPSNRLPTTALHHHATSKFWKASSCRLQSVRGRPGAGAMEWGATGCGKQVRASWACGQPPVQKVA